MSIATYTEVKDGKCFAMEARQVRLIQRVCKRLYDMKGLNADEMRDNAHLLSLVLNSLIEFDHTKSKLVD